MRRLSSCVALAAILSALSASAKQRPPASASFQASGAAASVAAASKALSLGRLDEALRLLDALEATDPKPAGAERLRGFIYYQQKNMAAAEAAYAKAVSDDPTDRESLQMRGVTLYSMGRPAEAIPLLEQAHASVASANVDPNYVLGVCYIAVRRYDDARHAFAAQYGFPADSAAAYLLNARLLLRQENPAAAEDSARKAIALEPGLPLAHQLLGEVALARAQLPAAIAELNKERELNPLNGAVYDRLGDAYLRSGEDATAQEALSRAVLLEPNSSGPYIQLGHVMLNQQNYLLASLYLERAIGMDAGNAMAHTLLGQAYRRSGRIADGDTQFQIARQLTDGKTPTQPRTAPKLESVH